MNPAYLRNHQRIETVIAVLLAAVTVFLFVLASAGCDEDEGGKTSAAAVEAAGPGSDAGGFGDTDFQALLNAEETAGRQLLAPLYRDLDGDGQSEALVMARGEGEEQPLDWYVYALRDGQPARLFSRTGVARGELSLDRPWIEEREALYNPGDPDCCPSAFVVSRYSWENGALVLMDRTKVPAL